jgi:hypothetical protein
MLNKMKGLSFWRVFLVAVVLAGATAYVVDRLRGYPLHLYEEFPWDISATLNIFCGLSLAAGGMTVAAVLAVLELSEYQLLRKSSLLIAYLGFLSALLVTILRYRLDWRNIWSLWSPHSIPAGAGVALLLYSVIVFDSVFTPRRGTLRSHPAIRYFAMLLTCLAAFLAGLQESAFLNVMAVAPGRFSPIWVTSMLSVNMFLSGVSACLALTLIALWSLARSQPERLPARPLHAAAAALRVVLIVTIGIRMLELTDLRQWHNLANNDLYGYLLGLELVFFLTPALFLLSAREREYKLLYECSVMVIAGFLTNRLNTAITSREIVIGMSFRPRLSDMTLAVAVISLATAAFICTMRRHLETDLHNLYFRSMEEK